MSKFKLALGVMLILASCGGPASEKVSEERLTRYVNPFIGTDYHGHTYPGAAWPFGQIQLSPDNATQGWDWCSGYHYSDSVIAGFSHLHLSGTGIGDLADISFLPVTSEVTFRNDEKNMDFVARYAGKYRHENESAEPGYYSVTMNNGIKAEFTVAERAGFHRYTFPVDSDPGLIINLGFAINWDSPYKTSLTLDDSTFVTGMRLSKGWAADQHVWFAARFSEPVVFSEISNAGGEDRTAGYFKFRNKELLVKVSISSVSAQNAIANLDSSLPGWDFDRVKQDASDAWEQELSKIRITSIDDDHKTVFYTALYHTMVAP